MAYDSFRHRTVLYGGANTNGLINPSDVFGDTWEYTGAGWEQKFPAHSPPQLLWHTLTYDAARGVTVLFGGRNYSFEYNDVWEWNGVDWTQVTVSGGPPGAREAHGMSYDSDRGVHVLFGGYQASSGETLRDTWEYNGTTRQWTLRSLSGPSARSEMSLVFDAGRNYTVLFGGYDASITDPAARYLRDTWTWDGNAGIWTWHDARINPGNLAFYSMAYDSDRGAVLLHCGTFVDSRGQVKVRESWEWGGIDWHYKTSEYGFYCCPRQQAAMVYESGRGQMLLFGGDGADPAGTWVLAQIWKPSATIYVDWRNLGPQDGSSTFPWRSVAVGVAVAGNCSTISIYAGDYPEGPQTFSKRVRLEARNGGAYIH
jgi:Galactose oxidase, central domain